MSAAELFAAFLVACAVVLLIVGTGNSDDDDGPESFA